MKLSEAEWAVLEALWSGERFALGEVVEALRKVKGWSRNTVYIDLTRMEAKGVAAIRKAVDWNGHCRSARCGMDLFYIIRTGGFIQEQVEESSV